MNKKNGKKFKNSKHLEAGLDAANSSTALDESEIKDEKFDINCLTKMSLNPSELFSLPNSYLLSLTEIQELNFPTENLEEYSTLPNPIEDKHGYKFFLA